MEGFDDGAIFFSDNLNRDDDGTQTITITDFQSIKMMLKQFIKTYHGGTFEFIYRDSLKRNYSLKQYFLDVNLEDIATFDEKLVQKFYHRPTYHLPLFEEAATEVADELTHPRPPGEEEVEHIQIMLNSRAAPATLRSLQSDSVAKLVKIPGIVISTSAVRAKASLMTIQCRSCGNTVPKIPIKPGFDGYYLPRRCASEQAGQNKCPLDPYHIRGDCSKCIDFQILKLQELNNAVPQGDVPRHLQLYSDRFLCEKVVPGNRVVVIGVYSIKKHRSTKRGHHDKTVGVRFPYLRVIGITADTRGMGHSAAIIFTPEEEEFYRRLAESPDIYEKLTNSIAPSIYGFEDIKKAIACLLMGGSRKLMPDGLTRRGDINILLLGDPGTAKSQMLKFVEQASPIAVYTSGKGSSAAGLTASVVRDPHSRNFVMEGGAMVLADGGVVCIDEFDKMREDDRVAIHEAMEQQTISIAKAGITTTLNSRCSVLAAANSVFGRWDESKGAENINFMPTILSRFDMIFIVKDDHNEERDITIAKHVLNIHMKASETPVDNPDELTLEQIKKFTNFCRTRCGPRLSFEAGEKLKSKYVLMRASVHKHEQSSEKSLAIPITVRQLEAVIRMSESLAKMQLQPFATNQHVDEALRLFQVSTLDAAMSGSLAGADEFTSSEDHNMFVRIEKQLKRRFPVGIQVSENTIVSDFVKQKYPDHAIRKVIYTLIQRGEFIHRLQRKLLLRLK